MGVVTFWSDIGCPWARLALFRLRQARERLGIVDDVQIDHRVFALEVVNARPTPRLTLDAEVAVAGTLEPAACWQLWSSPAEQYPVTTLLALEAVQSAKQQGLAASEALDWALRRAMFAESRCISMRHVVLDVARETAGVDAVLLAEALDTGSARAEVMRQHREATAAGSPVRGSPHVFLPDGTDVHNPGITMRWAGAKPGGHPVVDRDVPDVYDEIVRAVAGGVA